MKALLIIDMQMEMQHRIDAGMDCVNPDAAQRISELSTFFRDRSWPVIHIRHSDPNPASSMHENGAGYPPMPCAEAAKGDIVFYKHTSSAFVSTGLHAHLTEQKITDLVVVGAVAGFCVNSAVRSGCDLGFNMTVVEDAVIGFSLPDLKQSAQDIFDMTMAHLKADFADVITSDGILRR